jgi:glycosyltransferase involved in cell wall biosynthesis
MIVRNEAHQLADCLAPVADVFDEIVIVDTGSRDDTPRVAQRFTPHVFHFPWRDSFSAARNESLRHARGEWIFWLDADDRLLPENVQRLRGMLDQLPSHPAAFMMDTVCVPREAGEAERLISHLRLFHRHSELSWQGRVHEQLRPCPSTLGYTCLFSDVRVHHVGYRDATLQQRKLERDVRLLCMDYAVDPDDSSTLLHLGLAHAQLGRAGEARRFLTRLLTIEHGPASYLRRVFAALGELALREAKFQDVVATMDRGLATFPQDKHLLYLQAEAFYELDRYEAARLVLKRIMSLPDEAEYHAGAPNEIRQKLAPRSLGEVLRIQGALAAAESVLLGVVDAFPKDILTWHTLGRVYIDMGNRFKLDEVRARLLALPDGEILASLLLAAWQLMRRELLPAEDVIERLVAQAPTMIWPRLMRAEVLNRRGAPVAARLQAYRDVLRFQPGNTVAARMIERLQQTAAQQPPVADPVDWCTSVMCGVGVPSIVG